MNRRTRVRIGCVAAVTLPLLAACGSNKATPSTALGGLSASPVVTGQPTPTPAPPVTGPPTATPAAVHGQTHTTSSSSAATMSGVTVKVKGSPTIYTADCPYSYDITATITVDRPMDLTYVFEHEGHGLNSPTPIHFDAAGSRTVTHPYQATQFTQNRMVDSITVYGPGGGSVSADNGFVLLCVSSSGPITVTPAVATCPYAATFAVKVSVTVGPQSDDYQWRIKVGSSYSEVTGTLTFPGSGPQSQTITIQRILKPGSPGVSVSFLPNIFILGSDAVTATCL